MERGFRWVCILGAAFWIGCSDEATQPAPPTPVSPSASAKSATPPTKTPASPPASANEPDTRTQEELIAAGRAAYNGNCIACHNMDPRQDGALGPAVAGVSLELLEARVLHAQYPEGYKPKRDTRVMVALPHLKPRLVELAAYLDSLN
jgi:mono/diheme cytochrome c family protein